MATAIDRIISLRARKASSVGATSEAGAAWETSDGRVISAPTRTLARIKALRESGTARSADEILREVREEQEAERAEAARAAVEAAVKARNASPLESWLPRASTDEVARYHEQKQEQIDKLQFAEAGLPFPTGADAVRDYADSEWSVLRERGAARKYNANRAEYDKLAALPATPANAAKMALLNADMEGYIRYGDNKNEYTERKSAYDKGLDDTRARLAELKDTDWQEYERLLRETKEKTPRYNAEKQWLDEFSSSRQKSERAAYAEALKIEDEQYRLRADSGSKAYKSTVKLGQAEAERIAGFTADETTAATGDKSSPLTYTQQRIVNRIVHGASAAKPVSYEPGYVDVTGKDYYGKYDYLSDNEKTDFYYYLGKGDTDGAFRYLGMLGTTLEARETGKYKEDLSAAAKEDPAGGAFLQFMANFATPGDLLAMGGEALANAVRGDAKYEPARPSSSAYRASQSVSALGQGVEARIREGLDDTKPVFLGMTMADLAGQGYQLAQSIAQSGANMALFGPASIYVMGAQAAGNAAYNAAERGLAPDQAFLLGLGSGVVEAVTEKVSVDRFFKLLELGKKLSAKQMLLRIAQQMVAEGSEEVVAEELNNLVDIFVAGDASEYARYKAGLVESGMSESEAEKSAMLQYFVKNAAVAGIGGAVSGGLFGGAGAVGNNARVAAYERAVQGAQAAQGAQTAQGGTVPQGRENSLPAAIQGDTARGNAARPDVAGLIQSGPNLSRQEAAAAALASGDTDVNAIFPAARNAGYNQGEREGAAADGVTADGDVSNLSSPWDLTAADVTELFDAYEVAREDRPDAQRAADIINKVQLGEQLGEAEVMLLVEYPEFASIAAEYESSELGGRGLADSAARQGDAGQVVTARDSTGQVNTQAAAQAGQARGASVSGAAGLNGEVSGNGEQGGAQQRGEILDRGYGRVSDESDGVAVENVSGEQGQDYPAEVRRAADNRRNLLPNQGALSPRVSPESLGITGGFGYGSLLELPKSVWDEGLSASANEVRRTTGGNVRFVLGKIQVRGAGSTRGVLLANGDMVVQADDLGATAEQVTRHELFHALNKASGSVLVEAIRAEINRMFPDDSSLRGAIETYYKHYMKALAGHGLAREQIESYILEEIFADAYAGINAFGVDTSRWSEISARYSNAAADRAASARSQTEAATARTTGPPSSVDGGQSETDEGRGEQRFSVNRDFYAQFDAWDGKDTHGYFTLGEPSRVLLDVGIPNRAIIMDKSKMVRVIREHGLSRDVLRGLPEMIDKPVLILESRTQRDTYVLYGELYERRGVPVLAALRVNLKTSGAAIEDVSKITSTYAKDNTQKFIDSSTPLYADTKRIAGWANNAGLNIASVAQRLRLQLPLTSRFGDSDTRNIPDSKAKSNRNSAKNQSQSDSTIKAKDFTKDDITPEAIESNRDALQKYSIAFHGSPYSFDEFLLDHIGSGEGAQAHGWGLYFAADEKLAAKYKDVLSERRRNKFIVDGKQFTGVQLYDEFAVDSPEYIGSHALKDANGDVSGAVKFLRGVIADLERNEPVAPASVYRNATVEAANEAIAAISDGRVSYDSTPAPGALYTVDIPDEDVMLREDGTLWDQPDFIQDLLEEEFDEASYIDNATGRDVYLRLSDEYGKRGASEWLNERGIKGIVYGGRRDGKAYVVFDDKAIKILDKAAEVVSGGAEQRFSIGEAEDGTRFVEVDTDQHLFDGAAISDYPKIARRYIRARFRGIPLQVGTNGTARVSNRSAGEYAHSARPYKARAATELDNLLKVSKYSHSAPDESGRKFASDGWEYRAVKFRVDGVMFEGLINIAKSPNGALFYDMTNIEPSALNGQTKNSSSASLMAKSSVANNISNSGAKSNRNSAKNQSQSDSTIKVEDFTKFSLSEPIEATRDLIAVHNLSVGQLNESIRLGGFAMPSIAVTTSEMEHDRYGDVTVLFGRDTIDPKRSRNNRVYSGDAWTPSFPETGYKANSAVVRNARSIRNRLLEKYGLAYGDLPVFDASEVESDLRRSNGNLSEFYAHSNKMRLMYALDKGLAQPIYKAKDYGVAVPVEFFPALVEAVGEARITEAASGSSDLTRALAPVITETVNALSRDEYGVELFKEEIPFSQLDHVVDSLAKYIRNGAGRELDAYATRDAVDAALKDDDGYTRWLDELFDGVVEKRGIRNSKDFFTNAGNRRSFEALYDEITLDNILKAMKRESPKAADAVGGTVGIRASASREFKSVKEIRGAVGQLKRLSQAEYDAAKAAVDRRVMGVINEMVGESERLSAMDAAAGVLADAVSRSVEPGAIYNYVRREWGEGFTPELARELSEAAKEARELPTEYFEAKPRRIVGFDEVRAVIVPDSVSDADMAAIEGAAPYVATYKTGDSAARLEAVNRAADMGDVRFSLSEDDAEGNALTNAQSEFFESSAIRDDSGKLLPVYHTTSNEFTVFDRSRLGENTDDNASSPQFAETARLGFWFHEKPLEYGGGRVEKVYLNIVNPYEAFSLDALVTAIAESGEGGAAFAESLAWDGYDGIAVYDEENDGMSWVAFREEQIKQVSNLNPTTDPDIRFSLSEDDIAENKRAVAAMAPVATLTGDEFRAGGKTLASEVSRYYSNLGGSVSNPDIGEISLTRRGAKDSIAHGVGNEKAAAFAAVPDVLLQGKVISSEDNWKGRGYDSFVIAAPVTIADKPYFEGVVVKRTPSMGTQRFYVHEVYTNEGADDRSTEFSAQGEVRGGTSAPTVNSLLRELWDVKRGSDAGAQKLSLSEADYERIESAMGMESEYAAIRRYLRTSPVSFAERDKGDGSDYGFDSYGDMRKRYFGKIKLVNKGGETPDGMYTQLQSEFGEGFFPNSITHPLDRWRQILDVVDEAYANKSVLDDEARRLRDLRNAPNSSEGVDEQLISDRLAQLADLRELGEELDRDSRANRDLTRQGEQYERRIGRMKESFKKQSSELRDRHRASLKARVEKDNERMNKRIGELKSKNAAANIRARERRDNTVKRGKIKASIKELDVLLRRPTDTKHIPENMRAAVAQFLANVNVDTPAAGKNASQAAKDSADARRSRLDDLTRMYRKMAREGDTALYLDPDLLDKADAIFEVMRTKPIRLMSGDELGDLLDVVRGVTASVRSYNKMFGEGTKTTVSAFAGEVMRYNYGQARIKPYTPSTLALGRALGQFTNVDLLDSFSMFEELGPAMNDLFRDLREGMNIKIRDVVWAQSAVKEALDGVNRAQLKAWREKSDVYKTSGGESIRLTDAQIMSLFLQSKQEQALNHYFGGGITLKPKTVKGSDGKLTTQLTRQPVKLTPGDLGNMLESLNGEQRAVAERLSKLFDKMAAWGNEVSMTMWGYRKFTEMFYFPLVSDTNFVSDTHADLGDSGGKLVNLGSTKSRVKGANNAVVVEDIFDVITRQLDHMSSYHAFVGVLANMERVMNYRLLDVSVKNAIDNAFGAGAVKYVEKLMRDVNGGLKADSGGIYAKVIRSTKASALGANARVILQQPTAYLRAAAMVDPRYLAQGLLPVSKSTWDTVLEYSPISAWRDSGHYSLDTSQQMSDIIMGKHSVSEMALWGIGKADQVTWKRLWDAVEHETAAKHKDLAVGSKAFYEAVAKRFDDIIDRTQVVDTVLHRSQIMRSNNPLVKSATAFMSEGIKSYNILRGAVVNAGKPGGKARAARVFAAVMSSMLLGSVVRSALDAWRDKDDDEEGSKFLKHLFGTTENALLDGDLAASVFGMLPYMRDLLSLFQGYGLDSMQGEAIERAYNSIAGLISSAIKGEEAKTTPWFFMKSAAAAVSALFGIPMKNAIRELEDLGRNALRLADMPLFEYQLTKGYYSVSGSPGVFYDILFSVSPYGSRPDADAYASIEAALRKDGRAQQQIDAAIRARALAQKPLADAADSALSALSGDASAYEAYKLLTPEMKAALDEQISATARGLTLDENTDIEVNGAAAAAIRARDAGVPEAAYLLYAQVRKLYDEPEGEPGHGSYSNAEIADTLDAMTDLTDEQKSALWVLGYTGDGTPLNTKLRDAGVSVKSANAMTATIARLEPLEGNKAVSNGQEYEAVLTGNYSAAEKRGAMKALVPVTNGKQPAYDKYVKAMKTGLSVNSYLTFRENDTALNNYLEYTDNGASRAGAEKMARAVMALRKIDDNPQIVDKQRYAAIVKSGVSQADQMAAIKAHTDAVNYYKLEAVAAYGVTPSIWVEYLGNVFDVDTNGGSPSQDEAAAAIRAIAGLNNPQRAALWQMQNTSWKPSNNPFGNSGALAAVLADAPREDYEKGTNPITGVKSA